MPTKFDVESYLAQERESKHRLKEEQARKKQSLITPERAALKELERYLGKEIPVEPQLDFEYGYVEELGICIQKRHITYVCLSYLCLESLPDVIGAFSKLKELHLNKNRLTGLPNSIGHLQSLRVLDLSGNHFTTLPDWIGNLSSLQFLYAQWGHLESLPHTIGNLVNLETLALGHNCLTSLPDSIGNLTKLTFLQFYHNQLTTLPASITNLQSLEDFNVNENPLTDLPQPVVQWIKDVNRKMDERAKLRDY